MKVSKIPGIAPLFSFHTPSASFSVHPASLRAIIDTFATKNNEFEVKKVCGPIKFIEITNPEKKQSYHFWGIHKDEQLAVSFKNFKQLLHYKMGIKTTKAIQIIGDSTPFSKTGTNFARSFLAPRLTGNHLVEYGYTGQSPAKDSLDINALVNEYIDSTPDQAYRFLANIVGHTPIALEQWECYGSTHVHNFIVVFNDTGMQNDMHTKFGDDVIMSDHLLDPAHEDAVICLEGGAQSFKQVVNSLALDLPIELAYNLRAPVGNNFFSTARFLLEIYNAFIKDQPPTQNTVLELYQQYRKTLLGTWNASRPDHYTKQALFEKALTEFINNNL
jgi:hypothetical protein